MSQPLGSLEPIEYVLGSDDPPTEFDWEESDGTPAQLLAAAFVLRVGKPGKAAKFEKSSGIVGANVFPNVSIVWAVANELNTVPVGDYVLEIKATVGGRDRYLQRPIRIKPGVLPVAP